MNLLLLACVVLPQLVGVPGDEERACLWPFGSGYAPYALRFTYGQPEGEQRIALHAGLDVSDRRVGTDVRSRTVFALEDGMVTRVWTDDGLNYISGLVVASKTRPQRAWLYMHLEKDSIRFAEGDEVHVDEVLGEVLFDDTVTNVPHLHLSRLGGDFAGERWESLAALSVRNPLALLREDVLGDSVPPTIEAIDGERLRFRADGRSSISDSYPGTALPASSATAPHALDVLVNASERDGGPHRLAPYRLTLTAQDAPAERFVLCLDGPLPDAEVLCESIRRAATPQEDPYFVLTNGADPDCTGFDATRAWKPKVGQHTLELSVEDVAGNTITAVTVVTAQMP